MKVTNGGAEILDLGWSVVVSSSAAMAAAIGDEVPVVFSWDLVSL